ncbi:hypothetical protein ABW19_dt0202060 [Dactylella cylindrospora]|nr:hypothetical protein ABW19_dt0202060 [Dactylella cylindrospora]
MPIYFSCSSSLESSRSIFSFAALNSSTRLRNWVAPSLSPSLNTLIITLWTASIGIDPSFFTFSLFLSRLLAFLLRLKSGAMACTCINRAVENESRREGKLLVCSDSGRKSSETMVCWRDIIVCRRCIE